MIYCRKCKTSNNDDASTCVVCDADLAGADGVRMAGPPILDDLDDLLADLPSEPPASTENRPGPVHAAGPESPAAQSPVADPKPSIEPPSRLDANPPGRRGVVPSAGHDSADREPFIVLPARGDDRPVSDAGSANSTVVFDDGGVDGVRREGPQDRPIRRAVRPDEVEPEQGPDDANVGGLVEAEEQGDRTREWPKRPAGEGELACRGCDEPNPETRRFCLECGATLPAFDGWTPPPPVPVPPPDTFWRKLTRTTAHGDVDRRTQRQIERDLGQADADYQTGRTLETRAAVALAVMAAIVAAVVAVAVFSDLLRSAPTVVAADSIVPGDPSRFLERHLPEYALDGNPATGFGIRIDRAGSSVDGAQDVTDTRFSVELQETVVVEQIMVDVGFSNNAVQLDPALYLRARRLVVYGFGEPMAYPVDDEAGPQFLTIPENRRTPVAGFEVEVLSVHDRIWDTYDVAMFVELGVVPAGP